MLATTATANARVVTDVVEQLEVGGRAVLTVRGGLARDSLRLGVLRSMSPEQRLGWLVTHLYHPLRHDQDEDWPRLRWRWRQGRYE